MNRESKVRHTPRGTMWACAAAALALSLGAAGCDNLLEVDLPAQLGDEALTDPVSVDTQISAIINEFENGFNLVNWEFHGREDGGEIRLGNAQGQSGDLNYGTSAGWYINFMTSRRFSTGLHEKLEKDWTVKQVPKRAQYLAISSLYEGAVLNVIGSSMCEVSLSHSKLMTPAETLSLAEQALTRALTEIQTAGDFPVPYGIASSARTTAYGLRAQVRWMKGDKTGALADAQLVPKGFTALVTRDASTERRNKAYVQGSYTRFAELYDVADWWKPTNRTNPATTKPWPAVIPFTGYPYLGILPDGRAVRDDGLPIRMAGVGAKTTAPGVEATAVADNRVKYILNIIQGAGAGMRPIHSRYTDLSNPIPLVNWKEMWLIRAELQGGQAAIDLVNELRAADNLPKVTYASATNAEQIRYMVIEERRRALFVEGRFFFTKLQNLDILWFPRGDGLSPGVGKALGGGVRYTMPDNEYLLNSNLTLTDRATRCDKVQAPIITI